MQLPAGITCIPITEWGNRHENFKVSFKKECCFDMKLPHPFDEQELNYHDTTKNFQWLIKHAIEESKSIRAIGNGWSFNDVCVSDGIVDTRELRTFFKMGASFISPAYSANGRSHNDLIFSQCGMSVFQMNRELEKENGWMRSMKASGASNGQTIVGATATGTHGAAYEVGAVHDAIVGLHIITAPDRHVWIERASYPVVSDGFTTWLGAEVIRDDDMFNAAVVSFGSFGFVHGVMLETDPIFLLEKHTAANIAYDDSLKAAINQLDFAAIESKLPFPVDGPGRKLYHFELLVNPHKFAVNDPQKGVYLKVMYKMPHHNGYTPPGDGDGKFQYGDELLGLIQTVLDRMGRRIQQKLVPTLVERLLPQAFASGVIETGTIGETFANTRFRGKAASAALAIDASHTSIVLEEVVKLNKATPFAGAIAFRFVKGTNALLGFTKFPKTCVLEMDGVEAASSRRFFEKVWNRLDQLNIPFTLHWGKINFILDGSRVRKMYGDERVDKWLDCRDRLLDSDAKQVFNNDFLRRCGLDQ